MPDGARFVWEVRSVNGRGLELRFRLPSGYDAAEPALREAAAKVLRRGNVNATLTIRQETQAAAQPDPAALEQALRLATELRARIPDSPPIRAELLLALPGVLRAAAAAEQGVSPEALAATVAGFETALAALVRARQEEGARLASTLDALIAEIARLSERATAEAADQPAAQQARVRESLRQLLADQPAVSVGDERLAAEIALLAARSDVREELDRLASHIDAARALLGEGAGIGRRLDFLMQEFNREANTVCAKSASVALTATGLALKAAIEQLREQVQNIE